ncbi:hypothetical protein LCGC14_0945410 [marine sediment metagenome]|uniref:DUF4064 domain-containing protein n=1 Tax=marine sediment metagenome TaxID=412755 RepID=A0A0F9NNK2_9ZZZZ
MQKKSVMGQIVSIFITILIVSVIAAMTFLFVGTLKTEVANSQGNTSNAYIAVNTTEAAGLTVVGFLSILFLALIFSAILTVVLRFVLPFMNLGNQLGGF